MAKLTEVRWHGRGGQGAKTAGYILAIAAAEAGWNIQAFPDYGAERRGAPMRSYVRISDAPIRLRSGVKNPAVVVVLDATLLGSEDVTAGAPDDALVIINTNLAPAEVRGRPCMQVLDLCIHLRYAVLLPPPENRGGPVLPRDEVVVPLDPVPLPDEPDRHVRRDHVVMTAGKPVDLAELPEPEDDIRSQEFEAVGYEALEPVRLRGAGERQPCRIPVIHGHARGSRIVPPEVGGHAVGLRLVKPEHTVLSQRW